ncbi:hypothetical protein [Flintibacter muris]|uniref:hypothetical protein n=1 Tax=Flintibacter muris TaxID=2941327 RepID=UPI0020410DF0|nr:hypothetical protein [Flintibacter muris]
MEQAEFLSRQFDLLSQRLTDPAIEWQDIADLRAEHTGEDEHRDTIRKGAKLFYEYLEAGWIKNPQESSTVTPTEATVQMRELQKERYKVQTEKLELNRWLRENARDELIVEHICQAVAQLKPLVIPDPIYTELSDREGVLLFGDEHYGTEFEIRGLSNEVINSYSPEIFENRMWNLLDQTISIVRKEGFSRIHVFSLGDFEDGLLRVKQLMQLRYGVVEGTVRYADFISNWLNELSKYVEVEFQTTNGNHTELRMLGQPKGTFTKENMSLVVEAIITTRLVNNPNFTFTKNPTGYIYADILGYKLLGIHGEVKSMEQAIKDFSQIYRVQLDFLIAGHKHHSRSETVGINQEVINVPSIIGVDDYSLSIHKTSNAGATFLVFEKGKGKSIEYAIKL